MWGCCPQWDQQPKTAQPEQLTRARQQRWSQSLCQITANLWHSVPESCWRPGQCLELFFWTTLLSYQETLTENPVGSLPGPWGAPHLPCSNSPVQLKQISCGERDAAVPWGLHCPARVQQGQESAASVAGSGSRMVKNIRKVFYSREMAGNLGQDMLEAFPHL